MRIKLSIFLLLGILTLSACSMSLAVVEEDLDLVIHNNVQQRPFIESTGEVDYFCKFSPLAPECYTPSDDLDFISPIPDEYTIEETFEYEMLNQMPSNWLLYSNAEYNAGGVSARVVQMDGFRAVRMYSDGLKKPPYPQAADTPTFIFTTKFNLDIDRKGIAYGSLMIPTEDGNSVTMGVSTGAVNTISVTIGRDMKLSVKVGGPFFYYSGSNDAGTIYETTYTLEKDTWYDFKFSWDAELNLIQAFIVIDEVETLLHEGEFHVSNRFNADPAGEILVPNVFKVTMPSGRNISGYSYLRNIIVERKVA